MSTGSRRWFNYRADDGSDYGVELDESTYETPALGFTTLSGPVDVIQATGTRPFRMRYLNLVRVDGVTTRRKRVYVGSPTAFATLQSGTAPITIDGIQWGRSSVRGEARKLIPVTDTELIDGDVDDNIDP